MQRQKGLGIVSIIGPGLIGGSIGLGLKGQKLAKRVIGVGHRDASLEKALKMHAIDHATKDLRKGVREADVVILCTSVKLIPEIAKKVVPWMKESSILTDVGSTKRYIVEEIKALGREGVEFIGGHPLAGSEQRGIEAARSWEALGARVRFLSPEEHDLMMAFVSHLPQVVSTSLVNTLRPGQLAFTAKGFKDTTRIASSDPALWQDILLQNRKALLEAITGFQKEIALVKKALMNKNSKQLFTRLKRAKARRDNLTDSRPYAVQN